MWEKVHLSKNNIPPNGDSCIIEKFVQIIASLLCPPLSIRNINLLFAVWCQDFWEQPSKKKVHNTYHSNCYKGPFEVVPVWENVLARFLFNCFVYVLITVISERTYADDCTYCAKDEKYLNR